MRNTISVLLLSGLLLPAPGARGQGQPLATGLRFGVRAGLSLATLKGTINEGARYQPGVAGGVLMQWRPGASFALQTEALFAQQGCRRGGAGARLCRVPQLCLHPIQSS